MVTLYFVSFIVLGTMIILNLFIGIVMNSMAEMHRELEAPPAGDRPAGTLATELGAMEKQLAALQLQVRAARARAEEPVLSPPRGD